MCCVLRDVYKRQAQAAEIWNEVVEDGKAFPQMEKLDEVTGHAFFTEQTCTGVAYDAATGEPVSYTHLLCFIDNMQHLYFISGTFLE